MKTLLSTIYGKAIAVLTIIALVMGIGLEGIQITTAYWNMLKTRVDSISATTSGEEALPSIQPANAPKRPTGMNLDFYRKEIKSWGIAEERVDRLAKALCHKTEGTDSPLCKE